MSWPGRLFASFTVLWLEKKKYRLENSCLSVTLLDKIVRDYHGCNQYKIHGGAAVKIFHKMNKYVFFSFICVVILFIWSAVQPHDRFVWWLEAFPVIAGFAVLLITYRRFRFTSLVYVLVCLHAAILLVGAHYTYEYVPIGTYLRELLDLNRNHYDRLGHFAQGFIPAMIAREIIIRKSPIKTGGWLYFFVVCFCLAFSAFFEFFEWWTSLLTSKEHGNAFLGTQGDIWDPQWDMFLAFCGANAALLLLGKFHDRQLKTEIKKEGKS
jgi:putative membrane protein